MVYFCIAFAAGRRWRKKNLGMYSPERSVRYGRGSVDYLNTVVLIDLVKDVFCIYIVQRKRYLLLCWHD